MAHVEFVDQTLRDGQQSLWGMQMRAGMALPIAPTIDRTGYEVVDFGASSMMEILVRNFAEDPWEGLSALCAALPHSRVRAGLRNTGIISMSVTPDCLMDLWIERLCVHGIRSFWIYDVLHWNVEKTDRLAAIAKRFDAEVVASLMISLSPVHTDAFYADRADALGKSPHVDRLILYDMAGLLTPERVRTLVPAVQARCHGKPLEIHSHNVLGLAPLVYLEAIALGVTVVHTCSKPLANGASMPSVEGMVRNLAAAGHTHRLDTRCLAPVAEHFTEVARATGWPLGCGNEHDLWVYEHQVPGGMTGTLKNQLAQHGMAHRLDAVLREIPVVRRALGWPGMATPFSQLVGVLAVMNVVHGDRWRVLPDEVLQYALGWYGQPIAPIEPELREKIDAAPRFAELRASGPPQPTLDELRERFDERDDDALILRYLIAAPFIEKMQAAGPVPRDFARFGDPALERVRGYLDERGLARLDVSTPDLTLALAR